MYESTKTRDAKSEGAGAESVDDARPNFWKSLLGFHVSQPRGREQNEAAGAADDSVLAPPLHEPRIIKQGNFDWGSFSAFEDGSIEVERNGERQWFRTFSELKASLSRTAQSRKLPAGGLIDA
jgi:hypothetical protein